MDSKISEPPRLLVKLKLKGAPLAQAPGATSPRPLPPTELKMAKGPVLKLKTSMPLAPPAPVEQKPVKIKFKTPKAPGVQKIALSVPQTPKTPTLKITNHAQRPVQRHGARPLALGLGYDSEASDREDDPAIEEQFILRMTPGDDCDYLRDVIEKREMGRETDVWMKFKDQRRAVVCVRGNLYAAQLVDLPCIIESSKTVDKKSIFKTADICQMLLVTDRLLHEDQVLSIPLNQTLYPHGITPPLKHVRHRRFRKRISRSTIESVERQVEELLALDAAAVKSKYELVDPNNEFGTTFEEDAEGEAEEEMYEEGDADEDEEMEDADANGDGDEDEGGDGEEEEEEEEDFDFDNEFEQQFETSTASLIDPALSNMPVPHHPMTAHKALVRSAQQSDSESDEDDDDDGDADEEDEEARNKMLIREEIGDLERSIRAKQKEYEGVQNMIVKQRIRKVIDDLKTEVEMKRAQLENN